MLAGLHQGCTVLDAAASHQPTGMGGGEMAQGIITSAHWPLAGWYACATSGLWQAGLRAKQLAKANERSKQDPQEGGNADRAMAELLEEAVAQVSMVQEIAAALTGLIRGTGQHARPCSCHIVSHPF